MSPASPAPIMGGMKKPFESLTDAECLQRHYDLQAAEQAEPDDQWEARRALSGIFYPQSREYMAFHDANDSLEPFGGLDLAEQQITFIRERLQAAEAALALLKGRRGSLTP